MLNHLGKTSYMYQEELGKHKIATCLNCTAVTYVRYLGVQIRASFTVQNACLVWDGTTHDLQ